MADTTLFTGSGKPYGTSTNDFSTVARNGSNTACSSMSTAQRLQYYFSDTSLGTIANAGGYGAGLKDKLADGRLGTDWTDWQDALIIRSVISQN
jgi:hypothetical protein